MGKSAKARVGRPAAKDAGEVDARILSAATDMFLVRGYDGTTCEAVAAAAGASKATLYARYSGKPDLFAAVIRANVEAALVPSTDMPDDLPLHERLTRAGRAVISHAMAPVPLELMRLFIAEAPRQRDLIREADALGRRAGIRRIAEAIAGPDRDDPAAIARAEPAASRFIDLAFVPHQMRALLGDEAADLEIALQDRIAVAIDALEAAGLIPKRPVGASN
ncbi:TetR/AcrR family transcriptional regulator [Rubellimicrobium roseum]|uniref:TetR/AcrR family transcriptional regulator n=1 Tax=Rubellimicrobium roseum TaxID=687525 RepID=A0A5C4NEH2_9RHOB|nr:TetR/AcrR family transcriptional regulator [Rubellimicrobium roseum]TNC71758.1 TetR/AcrR family transcriptional regulator [Rubellimicrobium roseum]